MAIGDVTIFDDSSDEWLQANLGDLAADDIRLGLITSATTPAATDALPHFGGTGTTDLSTNETTGGEIAAGGIVLVGEAVTGIAGGALFDSNDISVNANAANPTAVRWGILYNNTLASNRCIGFLDFGSDTTLVNGLTITINAGGWFDMV